MFQMLARPPRPGERISPVTGAAIDRWFATERDARRIAWLDAHIGAGVNVAWRALGLSCARVFFDGEPGDWRWQPAPGGSRLGTPAIVVPIWAYDPGAWANATVIDEIAVAPDALDRVASLTGLVGALGEDDVRAAREDERPIVWHRTALSWLRAGGDAARIQGLAPEVGQFHPFAPCDLADELLLGGRAIIAADDAHALELEASAHALRRRLWPAPRIGVACAEAA